MADDARLAELRGLLATSLRAAGVWWAEDTDGPADRLLPVVSAWAEQHAARRAAEELRTIVLDAQIVGEVMHERGPIRVPITYLSERAAALTPASEEKL